MSAFQSHHSFCKICRIYKAYRSINFCGNLVENFKFLIDDNDFIPLLIGEGELPRIWMYVKYGRNSHAIVRDSIAILPQIKVNIYVKDKKLDVELLLNSNKYKLIQLDFADITPSVSYLNLQAIGYDISGDSESLKYGNNVIKGNHFSGLKSVLRIENKKS